MRAPPRRFSANLRYLWALLRRFRVTLSLALVLFVVFPAVYQLNYVTPEGQAISYGRAFHHVYFLLFGQPSLEYVDNLLIEVLNLLIPPFGIAVVVDGIVRFAYLYFAKHRSDKEWIAVISQTLKDHIIICGAGRVGYRVALQLLQLSKEIVVIEKNEQATFVQVLRDMKVPVLIENVKSHHSLERTNVNAASAIVCATDDDLANLNIALDARRANPRLRVVIRLFDDDLVARVKDNFQAEALSSSAVAAAPLALAALDPRIIHSFQVGKHLMVVSNFTAAQGLTAMTVSEVRDRFGGLTLSINSPDGKEELHPRGHTKIGAGDVLTLQSRYEQYLSLRDFTGEARPPLAAVPPRIQHPS
jgi:voltage-gated potassium channel